MPTCRQHVSIDFRTYRIRARPAYNYFVFTRFTTGTFNAPHIHKNVKTTGLTRSSRNFTPCGESAGSQQCCFMSWHKHDVRLVWYSRFGALDLRFAFRARAGSLPSWLFIPCASHITNQRILSCYASTFSFWFRPHNASQHCLARSTLFCTEHDTMVCFGVNHQYDF